MADLTFKDSSLISFLFLLSVAQFSQTVAIRKVSDARQEFSLILLELLQDLSLWKVDLQNFEFLSENSLYQFHSQILSIV